MHLVSVRNAHGLSSTHARFSTKASTPLKLRRRSQNSFKTNCQRRCHRLNAGSENKDKSLLTGDTKKPTEDTQKDNMSLEKPAAPPPAEPPHPLVRMLRSISQFFKNLSLIFQRPVLRFAVGCIALFGVNWFYSSTRTYQINVLYSEFVKQVESGVVETVFFESKTNNLRFTYKPEMWDNIKEKMMISRGISEEQAEKRVKRMQTRCKVVPGQTESLTQLLQKKQIRYGVVSQTISSALSGFLVTLALLWIPFLPFLHFLRKSLDARLGSKGKRVQTTASSLTVKFNDVAGMDEAKAELLEVVDLLKNPSKYSKLNVKIPSGVLLWGPTGTGKTLLARAVAGEAGVPFFAVSASEFVEMFVGRGAARIRELFKEARNHTPCVVFIDEIDSVGGIRGNSSNEERDQTLNQLLVELDGFEDNQSIVLLAATNRFNSLDPALLRPGRLTRKIKIPLPNEKSRAEILAVHLREVPMEDLKEKTDACEFIAKLSIGFSGAELANTVNEAALMAAREDRDKIYVHDLIRGLQRTKQPVNESSNLPNWLSSLQRSIIDQSWRNSRLQLPS